MGLHLYTFVVFHGVILGLLSLENFNLIDPTERSVETGGEYQEYHIALLKVMPSVRGYTLNSSQKTSMLSHIDYTPLYVLLILDMGFLF